MDSSPCGSYALRLNKNHIIRNAVHYHNNSMNATITKYPQIEYNYFIQIALNNSADSPLNFLSRFGNNSLYSTAIYLLGT